MILKPNMAIAGKKSTKQASVEEVAEKTIRLLKSCVPAAVPGIAFLSGGQSDEDATAHLNAMNRIGGLPWKLTYSYGRALQAAPQKAWSGSGGNRQNSQMEMSKHQFAWQNHKIAKEHEPEAPKAMITAQALVVMSAVKGPCSVCGASEAVSTMRSSRLVATPHILTCVQRSI
jgi:hypothetical protein